MTRTPHHSNSPGSRPDENPQRNVAFKPGEADLPMDSTELRVRITTSGLAFVTLDRPQVHNAFDEAQIERLTMSFEALSANDTVRVVILRGSGRHFCAGADIGWMRRAAQASEAENLEDALRFSRMMRAVADCSKPVIAVVQGAAFGGGMGLACAADIVIAADNARFALTEAKFGILPAVIGPYVVNAIGRRHAMELALTCRALSAPQAQAIGLVQHIVASESLDAALLDVLRGLLRNGPAALREIKKLLGQLSPQPISDTTISLTARTIARVRATAEAREGFTAFVDKRDPGWVAEPMLDY